MSRARRYRSPSAAIDDGRDPCEVGVGRIVLSMPQRLALYGACRDGDPWVEYAGSMASYDVLADWGLVELRQDSTRITARGRRWVNASGAAAREGA